MWVYVGVAAFLAISRIALFVASVVPSWHVSFRYDWLVAPEERLFWLVVPRSDSALPFSLLASLLMVVGSFVLATPVLVAAWLLPRLRLGRRVLVCYVSCGTILTILRVGVLVSVSGVAWHAPWSRLWILCPEALLLVNTQYENSFAFVVLLALGSFVMTTPILLAGWLWQRRRSRNVLT